MKRGVRGEKAALTPMIGKAGEYAVASELMFRGVNVFWPSVDSGYDLLTESGCRIQVKSAHMRVTPSVLSAYREGVYSFHFPKLRRLATSGGEVRTTVRPLLSTRCDVIVLMGIEQHRYWIVPSPQLDPVHCIFMGPKNARAFDSDMPNIREMDKLGFSKAEIGRQYKMSAEAIGYRLRASEQHSPNSAACSVRNCEDAWDNILDFPACKLYSVANLIKEDSDAII